MRPARVLVLAIVVIGCVIANVGCAVTGPVTPSAAPADTGTGSGAGGGGSAASMPTGVGVDYQLGGAYDPPAGVGIVVRDGTAEPAPGVWSICYVNGFQTQPGELERWTSAGDDLLLRDAGGELVMDPGWPDEALVDTSDAGKIARIAEVLGADIDRCADRGFAAVEIDNLDSFTRSNGRLGLEGATALARAFAERVHARGLLIGQKNAAEQAQTMAETVGFDFAVAEECVAFAECGDFTRAYGERVIDIEYPESGSMTAAEICAEAARPTMLVIRDRDLVAAGSPGYLREVC